MRKYLMIDLNSGECKEISEKEFRQLIKGCEKKEKNRNFETYRFDQYIVINDLIAEYDE